MRQISQRTCVGCLAKKPKTKLSRLVAKGGQVAVDLSGRAPGRGAYLCQAGKGIKKSCFKKAIKGKAFKRTFKKDLDIEGLLTNHGQEKEKNNNQEKKASLSTPGGGRPRPC